MSPSRTINLPISHRINPSCSSRPQMIGSVGSSRTVKSSFCFVSVFVFNSGAPLPHFRKQSYCHFLSQLPCLRFRYSADCSDSRYRRSFFDFSSLIPSPIYFSIFCFHCLAVLRLHFLCYFLPESIFTPCILECGKPIF